LFGVQGFRSLSRNRGSQRSIGACDTGKFDQQAYAVQLAEIYYLLVVLSQFFDAGNHFRQLRQGTRLSIGQGQGDKFMLLVSEASHQRPVM
jgi:hypothetical protein